MWTDAFGNAVTLADGRSLAAVNDFVEGFIANEARAVNVLAAAESDPSFFAQVLEPQHLRRRSPPRPRG